MPSKTDEEIKAANAVDLPEFLMSHGENLIRSGRGYRLKEHNSLFIQEHKWYWNSRSIGGNNIKFIMEYYNKTFPEAVDMLNDGKYASLNMDNHYVHRNENKPPAVQQHDKHEISFTENSDKRRAIAYLTKTRNLDYSIVSELVKQRKITQDSKNNVVFKVIDENGVMVGGELVGTTSDYRFKGIIPDSAYGYGFEICKGKGENALFFESSIDLLSYLQMYPDELDNHRLVSMIGLKPSTVEDTIQRYGILPENTYICVDNDTAGNNFFEKIHEQHPEFHRISTVSPYKDWNEQLKEKKYEKTLDFYALKRYNKGGAEMDISTTKSAYADTIRQVTASAENWAEFLRFAAKLNVSEENQKHNFSTKLLVFRTNPNATECKSFAEWKALENPVSIRQNGIPILTDNLKGEPVVSYVFDVSQTIKHIEKEPFVITQDNQQAAVEAIKAEYGITEDYSNNIENLIADIVHDEVRKINISDDKLGIAASSMCYEIYQKFGIDIDDNGYDEFLTSANEISSMSIRDIAEIGIAMNRIAVPLENIITKSIEKESERSIEYGKLQEQGRDGVHLVRGSRTAPAEIQGGEQPLVQTGRGNMDVSSDDGTGNTSGRTGQIRSNATEVSGGTQTDGMARTDMDESAVQPLHTDGRGRTESDRADSGTENQVGGIPSSDGRFHENISAPSAVSDGSRRTGNADDLRINEPKAAIENESITAFSVQYEQLSELIANDSAVQNAAINSDKENVITEINSVINSYAVQILNQDVMGNVGFYNDFMNNSEKKAEIVANITDAMIAKFPHTAEHTEEEKTNENVNVNKNGDVIIGNTPFKYIGQKSFTNVDKDIVDRVAEELENRNIKFSGVLKEDTATITVSRQNLSELNEIINSVNSVEVIESTVAKSAAEIEIGDKFLYNGKEVTVSSMTGVYPDDIGITRSESASGIEYAVTENVDKFTLARNGTYLGNVSKPEPEAEISEPVQEKKKIPNTIVHRNYKKFEQMFPEILNGEHRFQHYESPTHEPLSIETISDNQISIMQTYVQNGDLMYDPDIVLNVDTDNQTVNAASYEQSALGIYETYSDGSRGQRDVNAFMNQWLNNMEHFDMKLVKAIVSHEFENSIHDIRISYRDGKISDIDGDERAVADYIAKNNIELPSMQPKTSARTPEEFNIGDTIMYQGKAWEISNMSIENNKVEMLHINALDNIAEERTFYGNEVVGFLKRDGFEFTELPEEEPWDVRVSRSINVSNGISTHLAESTRENNHSFVYGTYPSYNEACTALVELRRSFEENDNIRNELFDKCPYYEREISRNMDIELDGEQYSIHDINTDKNTVELIKLSDYNPNEPYIMRRNNDDMPIRTESLDFIDSIVNEQKVYTAPVQERADNLKIGDYIRMDNDIWRITNIPEKNTDGIVVSFENITNPQISESIISPHWAETLEKRGFEHVNPLDIIDLIKPDKSRSEKAVDEDQLSFFGGTENEIADTSEVVSKDNIKPEHYEPDLNSNVQLWYMQEYPTDSLGESISEIVTFADIQGKNINEIYDVLGVGDSVVRERVQEKLAEIVGYTDLEKAKSFIKEFCEKEFGSESDFSDLSKVSIAYTTDENNDLEIQVSADLEQYKMIYEYGGNIVREEQYNSLAEMNENVLSVLDYDDIVALSDDEKAPVIQSVIHEVAESSVITQFREKTEAMFNHIDGYSASEIEAMVRDNAETAFKDNEISATIDNVIVTGSRSRGLEHDGSDIDVVMEVSSDLKEDALFNILHENPFDIGGIPVDINPIRKEETGTLATYLPTAENYLTQKANENHQIEVAESDETEIIWSPVYDSVDEVDEMGRVGIFATKVNDEFYWITQNANGGWDIEAEWGDGQIRPINGFTDIPSRSDAEAMFEEYYHEYLLPSMNSEHESSISKEDRFANENKLNPNSQEIFLETQEGTWSVVDSRVFDGKRLFELESDNYGFTDLVGHIIADENRNIILENVNSRNYLKEQLAVHTLAEALGCDEQLLREMTSMELNETSINAYGRLERLKDTVDISKAQQFFESIEGEPIELRKVSVKLDSLLRSFIQQGGFDIQIPEKTADSISHEPIEYSVEEEINSSHIRVPKDTAIEMWNQDFDVFINGKRVDDISEIENSPEDSILEMSEFQLKAAEDNQINERFGINAPSAEKENISDEQPEEKENPDRFHIKDYHLGEGGAKHKFQNNIEAIRTLKQIESEERSATPEEKEILSKYVGWGGLQEAFDRTNETWEDEYYTLTSLLTPEEYDAARRSTLDAFYTSPVIVEAIYKALDNIGFDGGEVLEPAMGIGNFFGMMPDKMRDESHLMGVELDDISGRIAKQIYPEADITISGYEKMKFENNQFDVAVGNVPFGDTSPSDKTKAYKNLKIHDYFFAKTADKIRAGGIMAFVTSSGTLDKQNVNVRKMLAQKCELLGAIRLPNNAFKKNAGTEVTSDIIFLQKREKPLKESEIENCNWIHLDKSENGLPINQYFVENPQMVLGTLDVDFRGNTICKADPEKDLREQLNEAIKNIKGSYTAPEFQPELDEKSNDMLLATPDIPNFTYTVVDDKLYYRRDDNLVPLKDSEQTGTRAERRKGMCELADTAKALLNAQVEGMSNDVIESLQAQLNTQYDSFVEKFGFLNKINSKVNPNAIFKNDVRFPLLQSLEKTDGEHYFGKADIFTKRTISPHKAVEHTDTSSEALIVSISEKSKVDLDYMADLTGFDKERIVADLKGVIYPVPELSTETNTVYQTAEEYLSGNIYEKMALAENAAESNPIFADNIEALKKAMPEPLTAGDITVKLGATWIDPKIIQQFMYEVFDTPQHLRAYENVSYQHNKNGIELNFSDVGRGGWNITNKNNDSRNVNVTTTYGTESMNAYELLEAILNLKSPKVYKNQLNSERKEVSVIDQKATEMVNQKVQSIKNAFSDWIFKDPERRQYLVDKYNRQFNCIRPREYDGSHLNFSGMNPEIKLRTHQVNAIAHALFGGNSLFAHEVGAGKTFEMIATAMEGKRLGLHNKCMFAVPNHLTEQIASDFMKLYPNANILVAKPDDFSSHNRKKMCAKIATGNFDAVIVGHSQLIKIPLSPEREQKYIQNQIDELSAALESANTESGDRFTVKQIEKSKKALEDKLDKLVNSTVKDQTVTFEELGIDKLFVDEAHLFKNLFLATKMSNISGITSNDNVQKTQDLYMKCQYLDEITGNRGVTFATGTPVSNSMTEIYSMMKYLQSDELKKHGLNNFDSWASTFGDTVTEGELSPDNKYRMKTRFSKFVNVPELMSIFKQCADIKTADMLNLNVPDCEKINERAEPSEIQNELIQSLSERAEAVHTRAVDPSVDNMLTITNDGRKIGLDPRLIDPDLPDNPDSKLNKCVSNVFNIWQETAEQRSTQLIFCDLGVPQTKEDIKKNGKRFSVYDDIKQKLIEKGVPEKEIAFIHDAGDSEVKKAQMFSKVRSGEIRVLIGSTAKMGAGTNVQDKLIASHDLDCPWKPADMTQRAGRMIRQGNENKNVKLFRYVTNKTFDAYLFQTLEKKQNFISQVMTSKSPARTMDDVDEQCLEFAEIKALCAGDPRIKRRMDLEIEVSKYKMLKSGYLNQRYALEDSIMKTLPKQITSRKQSIAGMTEDIKKAAAYTAPVDEKGDKQFVVTVNGKTFTDKKEAGTEIKTACSKLIDNNGKPVIIGEYKNFQLGVSFDNFARKFRLHLCGDITHTTTLGDSDTGNFTKLDNLIATMEDKLENLKTDLTDLEKQFEKSKVQLEEPFEFEEQLRESETELIALTAELERAEYGDIDSNAPDSDIDINSDSISETNNSVPEIPVPENNPPESPQNTTADKPDVISKAPEQDEKSESSEKARFCLADLKSEKFAPRSRKDGMAVSNNIGIGGKDEK